jgi:hypothetical protein
MIRGLFNQTLTIYNKSSFNAEGREVVGAGTNYQARVQQTTGQKMLPNGSLITIDIIAYVQSDITVSVGDRIDYSGVKYKVFGKYGAVDGAGVINHYKLELIKWRET